MDDRLALALEFSNYMTTLNSQKRIIREQYLENCTHYLNGGKFSVTRELVNFCHMLVQTEQDDAVIIDDNDTPIKVENINEFLNDILDIYFTASNEFLDKYNNLKKNRTVEGLVNL